MKPAILSFLLSFAIGGLHAQKIPKPITEDPFEKITLTVHIDSTENVFLRISSQYVREMVIGDISDLNNLKLTDKQQESFASLTEFGCRIADLSFYLGLTPQKRAALKKNAGFNGMPVSEIGSWVSLCMNHGAYIGERYYEEDDLGGHIILKEDYMPVVIVKADKNVSLKTVKDVMDILQSETLQTSNMLPSGDKLTESLDIVYTEVVPDRVARAYTMDQGMDMEMGDPPGISISPPPPPPSGSEPLVIVDEFAEFPGGTAALHAFIDKNLVYPTAAREYGIQGKCYVKFVVGADGTISQVVIAKKVPDCPECDKEAVRVVKLMPKWVPARNHGKKVASYFNLPVTFKL